MNNPARSERGAVSSLRQPRDVAFYLYARHSLHFSKQRSHSLFICLNGNARVLWIYLSTTTWQAHEFIRVPVPKKTAIGYTTSADTKKTGEKR